jgi:CIC family chloride channel protein
MMPCVASLSRTPLRDFSVDSMRLVWLCVLCAAVGAAGALLAWLLSSLIGFITHVAYFGNAGHSLIPPDPRHWGPVAIGIPVAGALLVGLIARYGSDKIRGHGIPEAIQSILERDSIIQARVAFFKPLASAIAIGTGSPFGAEGPIIMTGGAFGSLFAQFLHVSASERRTLLVAGAAAGMAATFDAPIASVLIAVELLLFEWRPRSFIPVAVAAFVAAALRIPLMGASPPFVAISSATTGVHPGWALLVGLCGGAVSMLMTKLVYVTEDAYALTRLHWMWWPAIGAVVVGIGGWFVPAALGIGYPTIGAMVNGHIAVAAVAAIIVVKIVIWVASLSSGTSGGVLAPLLMIGAAMGTILAQIIPGHDAGAWAIVGMAALMGGTMRAPFMGTLFALETTHAWTLSSDVFVGCVAATAFTVMFVPRSILTEKLSRRGTHVSRDYAVHPLELMAVRDAMSRAQGSKPPLSIEAHERVRAAADLMASTGARSLAVVDEAGTWIGIVDPDNLLSAWQSGRAAESRRRRVRRFRGILRRLQKARS